MLFNSRAFLLVFLPLALLFYALASRSERWRLPPLLLISIIFYGYWDVRFVPLIVGSILFNWCAAELFFAYKRRLVITAAIAADLAVLAWFKYVDFLTTSIGLQRACRGSCARAAARHQLLHVSSHHVFDRSQGRQGAAL
jgi:alginate O-acetyltransferase complex protein AlgI